MLNRSLLIVILLMLVVLSYQHHSAEIHSGPTISEHDEAVPENLDSPTYDSPRSPKWRTVRNHFVTQNGGVCAACGTTDNPHVHHIKSFHEHPELELDPTNLIILCGPKAENCHLRIGHDPDGPGGPQHADWKKNNPNVVKDAMRRQKRVSGVYTVSPFG